MALPTPVNKLGSFKGDKGDEGDKGDRGPVGTFSSVSAVSVPADQPAEAIKGGTEEAPTLLLKVPRGLPQGTALDDDNVVATFAAGADTKTHGAIDARWLDRASYQSLVSALGASFRPQPGLWCYGHSFLANQGLTSGDYYNQKVASAFGMLLTNRAQGGTLAEDAAWRMWGGAVAFPAGHTAIVMLQLMMNSMRLNGDDAITKRGVEWCWRTCATIATAKTIVAYNDPRLTYSGTWAGGADTAYPGGGYRNTNVAGAFVEFTTQTPAKGTSLLTTARKAGLAANQIEIRNLSTGTLIQTWNNVDQAAAGIAQNYAPASILLDVPAGTVVRFTNLSGTGVFVGLAELDQVSPKPILAVKEPKLADWSASTAFPNGSDLACDAFNAIIDTVAADFPNMVVISPEPYWTKQNAAALVQADKVHPNIAGSDRLALAVIQAASRYSARKSAALSGSGTITSAPGIFTPAAGVTVSSINVSRTGQGVVLSLTVTGSFPAGWATEHTLGTLDAAWRPAAFVTDGGATGGATTSAAAVRPGVAAMIASSTGAVTARHDIGATSTVFRMSFAYNLPASL